MSVIAQWRRSGLTGLALLLGFALLAADAQAALEKPERKAVDIKKVEATTATTATLVEIKFKGDLEDELGTGGLKKARVTTELIPASGPTTVITDRKSSKKPKEQRKGTSGPFDVVRHGRYATLLIEELPEPIEDVTVTTSGPGKARGAKAGEFDQIAAEAGPLDTAEDIDEAIDDAIFEILFIYDPENEDPPPTPEEQERIELWERWIKHLESILSGETERQCSDGVDNGDPEDTIADHPNDPGCISDLDNDEKHELLPVDCPMPGATSGTFGTINTPQTNAFDEFVVRNATGEDLVRMPVGGESSGAQPLAGQICGPGVNVTYEWRQFTDGDIFGQPDPPPGDRAFQIVIFVDNPMGSGNPGDLAPTLGFAVGTVPSGP